MKLIMLTTGERPVEEYKAEIPGLEFMIDHAHDDYVVFQRALAAAGTGGAVIFEDDIILCENFYPRLLAQIAQRPQEVISFFSMRKGDLTIGSRYVTGRRFLLMQCVYYPNGLCPLLLEFSQRWNRTDYTSGTDCMVADFLGDNGLSYYIVVPNLVDHKVCRSLIDHRRSSKRQSFTFIK